MDKLLKKMVLSYELHKNQAYVDRLLKEGEISGYKKILNTYKKAQDNGVFKDSNLINLLESKIQIATEELCTLKATENILNALNKDLEDNLGTLDLSKILSEQKSKYPKDIEVRIKSGKCALKRPGKGGFVCDEPLVTGSKYCKEHLKKYDKITYTDLVPEND